jgi:hypothetical protein
VVAERTSFGSYYDSDSRWSGEGKRKLSENIRDEGTTIGGKG